MREGKYGNACAGQPHFPDEIPRSQDSPRADTSRPLQRRGCHSCGELPMEEHGSDVLASARVGVGECQRGAAVDADRPHLVEPRPPDAAVVSADCEQTQSARSPGCRIEMLAFDRSCQHAETGTVGADDGELGVLATRGRECEQAAVGRPDKLRCLLGESDLVRSARLVRSDPEAAPRVEESSELAIGRDIRFLAACERDLAFFRHVRRRVHVATPSPCPCSACLDNRRACGIDDRELVSFGRAGQERRHLLAPGGDADQAGAIRMDRVDIPAAVAVACEYDPARARRAVLVATAAQERQREGCDAYLTPDSTHGWDRYRHRPRAARGP